jgi:transglutaminase-like putative cysteine protease
MENKVERWWDASAILSLIAAIWIVVWRIQATAWTRDLYRLETLVVIAFLLGLFLGKSRFNSRLTAWMGVFYTCFFITWQLGLSLGEDIQWPERLVSVSGRLVYSLNLFFHNKPVLDPLLFLALMGLLYWLISFTASYQLVRNGRPWVALFIAAVALVAIDFYDRDFALRAWFDGIFFLLALMLISRVFFLHSRKEWDERGAVLDPEVGLNVGGTVFIGGIIVILIAWNFPFFSEALQPGTVAQERTNIAWDNIRNRLGNLVAGLRGKPVYEATAYPNQINLGTGKVLGDDLIFTVNTSAKKPEGKRYYWRGYSYDHYALGYWRSTQEIVETKTPREWNYNQPNWIGRQYLIFSFTPESSLQRTIFAPDIPVSASRTSRVLRVNLLDVNDLVSIQADTPLQPGENFDVVSWVSAPTVEQLLAADRKYPDWVTGRYLQLPPDMPGRIKDLAIAITNGEQTQYDQVMAITSYLRRTIIYQDVIPNPPANREPIDWFLFDYKKGFCNYYASAEVLLLRSIGIPARLAIGYAEGTGDGDGISFKIKAHDSHAWPEVYFTNAGWVEFEPTASQPTTSLPQGSGAALNSGDNQYLEPNLKEPRFAPGLAAGPLSNDAGNPSGPRFFMERFGFPVLITGLTLGLLSFLWFGWQRTRLHLLPVWTVTAMHRRGLTVPNWLEQWAWRVQLSQIEWMYLQMSWMLYILGKRVITGQTPSERSEVLAHMLPSSKESVHTFLEEYHKAEYSPHSANFPKARRANRDVWKKVLLAWFSRITGL